MFDFCLLFTQASGLLVIILSLPAGETFTHQLKTVFLIALGDILNCIPIVDKVDKVDNVDEVTTTGSQTRAERQADNNATVR